MKIAYVYDSIYPYQKGGVEKRIWELATRLVQRGHEVHIFGPKFWEGDSIFKKDGVYLHGVCNAPKKRFVEGRRSISEPIYFAWKVLPALLKERFDIVDCQEFPYFPCFSAKFHSLFKRSRLFITWHEVWGGYWFQYLGKKGIFGWAVEKMTARLTRNNIAVSETTKRELARNGAKGDIQVIPNGIDFEKIERIKPSGQESDVIFAGRLIGEKNVDVLIKTIGLIKKDNPYVKCLVIGDGPEKNNLESLADSLGLDNSIKFTGFVENYDNVISHMKSSRVFALPSTREGFGIVALEANACGLPVVTLNHKSNAACEFIKGDNGFICELSVESLAKRLFMALNKEGNMKEGCIENAKRYDWDNIVSSVEALYLQSKRRKK